MRVLLLKILKRWFVFEKINFKNNLISSGGLSIGIYDNLNIISGAKLFSAKGNEYLIERNSYDQIIDYNTANFDISENNFNRRNTILFWIKIRILLCSIIILIF